jgi:hypothetical protein
MTTRTITGNLAADPEAVQAGRVQIVKFRVLKNTGGVPQRRVNRAQDPHDTPHRGQVRARCPRPRVPAHRRQRARRRVRGDAHMGERGPSPLRPRHRGRRRWAEPRPLDRRRHAAAPPAGNARGGLTPSASSPHSTTRSALAASHTRPRPPAVSPPAGGVVSPAHWIGDLRARAAAPHGEQRRARDPLRPASTLTAMSWGHFFLLFSPSFLALIIGAIVVSRALLLRLHGPPCRILESSVLFGLPPESVLSGSSCSCSSSA